MHIIVYEDEAVSGLFPIAEARPVFSVRSGGFTLTEALGHVFPKASISGIARTLVECTNPVEVFGKDHVSNNDGFLFLNGRVAPSLSTLKILKQTLSKEKNDFVITSGSMLVGLYTRTLTHEETAHLPTFLNARAQGNNEYILPFKLFSHPEDVVAFNKEELGENLFKYTDSMRSKKRGLYLGKNVTLPKECVIDTSKGPVVIGDNTVVQPFVVIHGPVSIGHDCLIRSFSMIESNTTIGNVCKIGGELESCVIDDYSNKQHKGSVGSSYVGSWVNIGGGTSISNLKNTYSNVTIQGRDSGSQFLGAIIGDYVKTAVNSSIFPGKIIGTASHVYGTVVDDVPAFVSETRPGKLFELPVAIAQKIQTAMAKRRGVNHTDLHNTMFEQIFAGTAGDRAGKNVSKDKLNFE